MSNLSPNDMKLVSDAVLDGSLNMDKLPETAQANIANYWASTGQDYGDPSTLTAEAVDMPDRVRPGWLEGTLAAPIFKPIEWVGSKLYWLYSNSVSPVLSMGFQALHTGIYGRPDYIGEDGEWDALQDYWDVGKSVSPGQAIWQLGFNNEELKERGIRPDQMAQDKKLAAKGQQTTSDEYFGNGAAKWVTGTTDFAVSWYMDPLVLAGQAVGAARATTFTKGVAAQTMEAGKVTQFAQKAVGITPKTSAEKLTALTEGKTFQSMVDRVMKIKESNPNNAALVLRRDFQTLSRSANGDVFARLLDQSRNADEVNDVLRVAIGDDAAKLALEVKNVKIADQIKLLGTRNTNVGNQFDALTDLEKATPRGQMIKQAMDDGTSMVNRLNEETRFIDDAVSSFGKLEALNFNRVTVGTGLAVRGSKTWQEGDKLKPVRGQGLIRATPALIYNTAVGMPIKLIRSYGDIRPGHYIDIHGEDSYRQVDASLREVDRTLLSRGEREMLVSNYVKANPADRQLELVKAEQYTISKMVERHNAKAGADGQIDLDVAKTLYGDFSQRRRNGQMAAQGGDRIYGSATMPDPSNPALTVRVAETDPTGSQLIASPIFDTQLANSHVMMDFNAFDRLLREQGSTFQKLKNRMGDQWDTKAVGVADKLGQYWKFAQLFRLGYAPRALADDFLGQVARFGSQAMMQRAIDGGKVIGEDFYRKAFQKGDIQLAKVWSGKEAQRIEELTREQEFITGHLTRAKAKGQSGNRPADFWQDKLDSNIDDLALSHQARADMDRFAAEGAAGRHVQQGRQIFDPAFGGQQGNLYKDLASGKDNYARLMGDQSDAYLRELRRLDWEYVTVSGRGETGHMDAWMRQANDIIGQSTIGRQALMGRSESEIAGWMKNTPEGQAYRRDIGLKHISNFELAQRVKAEVDHVLPPNVTGMDVARQAVLQGKLEKEMLEVIPAASRPMVNAEAFRYAEGKSSVNSLVDRGISSFYRRMNTTPAAKLLRNPLFKQMYDAHLADSMVVMKAQGITRVDEATRMTLQEGARQKALRDVKKFTFTMDHETKMNYSMRHFGAFFGAQQESWNRWARIIAEKPQALAHVAQTYGAPARAGIVTDQDGNAVDAGGFATNYETGERTLVSYTDRRMVIQIPDYLGGKAFKKLTGQDEGASAVIPMSTLELILNNGDGAIPVGVGPIVQIAANQFAKDSPRIADVAQQLGVLPFGAQDSVMDFINPNTGKKLSDSMDDRGETKQRALYYMMQVEDHKYREGLRETEPTWSELLDRADRWTNFRTFGAFFLPISVNGQDPYQFFRDEFSRMQKLDHTTADEKFHEKYGDSFYMFSQSMSKNNTGLRPTAESVEMSQYYKDLIEKVGPEFAGVIVGDEGNGRFSSGAYFYQKTHSTDVASSKTDREQMGAREAWDEAKVAEGWQLYGNFRDEKYAELFDRGLTSFNDEGAEDLKNQMEIIEKLFATKKFDDGTENTFYNEEWTKRFNVIDKGKYDRNATNLQMVVDDPEIWSKAMMPDGNVGIRSDIYTLRTYLAYRKEFQKALALRNFEGGSDDPTAQGNADLKDSWDRTVLQLIEADTKFSTLHSRYFSNDMGFGRAAQEREGEIGESGSLTGTTPTSSIFDVLDSGDE